MLKLLEIKKKIKPDLEQINTLIDSSLNNRHPKLNDIYKYLNQQRGKQVRSSIIILIGDMYKNPNKSDLHHLAAGIELIHLASLIHDDIIDEADIRRDQETIHKKFGLNNGIIIGVHAYSIALKLFSKIGNVNVIDKISGTVTDLCEGEFIQVNERHNLELSEKEYWQIVDKKTAALFKTSCQLSAQLCGFSHSHVHQLTTYGKILGDIFQLVDDYLDIYDTGNKLSKKVEQDLITGDISLPIIIAKQLSKSSSIADIKESFKTNNKIIANKIKEEIHNKRTKSVQAITPLKDQYNTENLINLLDIITDRIN
ncbi:MAG: polyprenyl synthetase family protein [Candidatus Margulisiibacteriota bacterium]|nr:polyprenyl synthetase family protein [Candidatus Margulisiibacteriota bacterium]